MAWIAVKMRGGGKEQEEEFCVMRTSYNNMWVESVQDVKIQKSIHNTTFL